MSRTRKILFMVATPLFILVLAALTFFAFRSNNNSPTSTAPEENVGAFSGAGWKFNGTGWQVSGDAPDCPDPLTVKTPVDINKVSSILYPGQSRGGDYKPHGGFRFDNLETNQVTVTAPMDAQITEASRYIENGEIQYLFEFIAPCGIAYRFDHLLTLSSELQEIASTLPEPKENDSRTTLIKDASIKQGDIIATEVGFKNNKNIGVDFGIYDLRFPNEISNNATWAAEHKDESSYAYYGTCWLDLLVEKDSEKVKALPAGDSQSGTTSDYCN
jgi:hypothetical protein